MAYQFLTDDDKTQAALELGVLSRSNVYDDDGNLTGFAYEQSDDDTVHAAEKAHYKASLVATLKGEEVTEFVPPGKGQIDAVHDATAEAIPE